MKPLLYGLVIYFFIFLASAYPSPSSNWQVRDVHLRTFAQVEKVEADDDIIMKMKLMYRSDPYVSGSDYIELGKIYYAENGHDRIFLFNIAIFDVHVAYVVDREGSIIGKFVWSAWS